VPQGLLPVVDQEQEDPECGVPADQDGELGAGDRANGEIDGVLAVRVESGYVTGICHVRNPEKLSRVEQEAAVSR